MRGNKLDLCLSMGYFRMQQDIFTCQFVSFNNSLYATYWLRISLKNVSYGTKQMRLLRSNQRFSVTVKPFVLTRELEELYALYLDSINFDAPESVESCLLGGAPSNVFDTYTVQVRDGDTLIAVGVFDNGNESIAGIMNFYHPDYRKFSLGKYLMLLKINYASQQGKTYYYPGYLVRHYPKFDYKLFPCEAATEVYDDTSGRWLPFSWQTIEELFADNF